MKVFKQFSKYVSVSILGMIGLSCYILADTFFVSNALGTNGLAALNLTIPVYSFINAAGLMLGIGGGTKLAALNGEPAGKNRGSSIFSSVAVLGLITGLLALAAGLLFSAPLAGLLGADTETLYYASIYLKTILCFAPFFILNNILLAFVRNDGRPSLAMLAMLIGSISNIVLDYLFMFPAGLGMFGAAFATGLAPVISIAVLSLHFLRKKNTFNFSLRSIKPKVALSALPLGLSSFITEMSSGLALIIFNFQMLRLSGNVGVAAYGVIANIALVCIAAYTGIAQGIQPLISRAHSTNDIVMLQKIQKYAIILSLILSAAFYIFGNVFSGSIISVFNKDNDPGLLSIAREGMLIYFAGFFFAGINIIMAAYVSAMSRPKRAFIICIVRGCIAIIIFAMTLPYLFGVTGVWLSYVLAEISASVISVLGIIRQLKFFKAETKKLTFRDSTTG